MLPQRSSHLATWLHGGEAHVKLDSHVFSSAEGLQAARCFGHQTNCQMLRTRKEVGQRRLTLTACQDLPVELLASRTLHLELLIQSLPWKRNPYSLNPLRLLNPKPRASRRPVAIWTLAWLVRVVRASEAMPAWCECVSRYPLPAISFSS